MSSSVQLLSGKTRTCSPLLIRPLYSDQGSGRWARGSHWPNSSRNLSTRSFARARSSSRRAPPNAASKPPASSASRRVRVCSRLREAPGPGSGTRPLSIDSCTDATISLWPSPVDPAVAELDDLGEVVPGVDVHHRETAAGWAESLLRQAQKDDRVLARREQQHRTLEFGDHLADDVHGLGLEQRAIRRRAACPLAVGVMSAARPFPRRPGTGLPIRWSVHRPDVRAPAGVPAPGPGRALRARCRTICVRLRQSTG